MYSFPSKSLSSSKKSSSSKESGQSLMEKEEDWMQVVIHCKNQTLKYPLPKDIDSWTEKIFNQLCRNIESRFIISEYTIYDGQKQAEIETLDELIEEYEAHDEDEQDFILHLNVVPTTNGEISASSSNALKKQILEQEGKQENKEEIKQEQEDDFLTVIIHFKDKKMEYSLTKQINLWTKDVYNELCTNIESKFNISDYSIYDETKQYEIEKLDDLIEKYQGHQNEANFILNLNVLLINNAESVTTTFQQRNSSSLKMSETQLAIEEAKEEDVNEEQKKMDFVLETPKTDNTDDNNKDMDKSLIPSTSNLSPLQPSNDFIQANVNIEEKNMSEEHEENETVVENPESKTTETDSTAQSNDTYKEEKPYIPERIKQVMSASGNTNASSVLVNEISPTSTTFKQSLSSINLISTMDVEDDHAEKYEQSNSFKQIEPLEQKYDDQQPQTQAYDDRIQKLFADEEKHEKERLKSRREDLEEKKWRFLRSVTERRNRNYNESISDETTNLVYIYMFSPWKAKQVIANIRESQGTV